MFLISHKTHSQTFLGDAVPSNLMPFQKGTNRPRSLELTESEEGIENGPLRNPEASVVIVWVLGTPGPWWVLHDGSFRILRPGITGTDPSPISDFLCQFSPHWGSSLSSKSANKMTAPYRPFQTSGLSLIFLIRKFPLKPHGLPWTLFAVFCSFKTFIFPVFSLWVSFHLGDKTTTGYLNRENLIDKKQQQPLMRYRAVNKVNKRVRSQRYHGGNRKRKQQPPIDP